VDQKDDRSPGPERHEDRNLIQVLDDHVEFVRIKRFFHVKWGPNAKRHSAPYPVDFKTIQCLEGKPTGEPTGQNCDLVTPAGQPAKNLVEMCLGSPGLRVRPIQPIDDENLQERAPWVTLEGPAA
jgi:hypothetical protein